jgi:hypothetical protein
MTGTFRSAWLLCALLFAFATARSQSFDYTLSVSSSTYQSIAGTSLGANSDWSSSRFTIPVGFTFQFAGGSFDSLTIESNGFIKFDERRAIVLYHGAGCKLDSNNVYSLLSYSSAGTQGNRIMKIQYTNSGYSSYNVSEQLSYQLWLYEQSGAIETHTGPNSYPGIEDTLGMLPTPLIGLINPMQDSPVSALLLTGDAASPSSQPVYEGDPLVYLQFVPPADKVYTFTPNGN